MSSHHIVREKQEPALLILGLNGFSEELLGQLLEWSPTVIATPDTVEKIHAYGTKIDWILTNGPVEQLQSDVKLLPVGSDSYAEAALKYLIAHEYSAVNVITERMELKDYLFYADKINLVIYQDHQKIYPIPSGFSKWKPGGEIIQLITRPVVLNYSGLKAMGNNKFKTSVDGFFSMKFPQPFIFIAEEVM